MSKRNITVNGKTYQWQFSKAVGAVVWDGRKKYLCKYAAVGTCEKDVESKNASIRPSDVRRWIETKLLGLTPSEDASSESEPSPD